MIDNLNDALRADVIPADLSGGNLSQNIANNPIQSTASRTTQFFFNVSGPDPSSTIHHFFGNVTYTYKGAGVFNRPVNVTISQTLYYQGRTDNVTGAFSFDVDLKPVGNAATPYEVLACFEDSLTIAANCTAWSKTSNGQDYVTILWPSFVL